MKKCCLSFFVLISCLRVAAQRDFLEKPFFNNQKPVSVEEASHYRSAQNALLRTTVASSNIDINYYRGEWEVDPAVLFIKGKVTLRFTPKSSTSSVTLDLSRNLVVDSVIFHNSLITFSQTADDGLVMPLGQNLNAGQKDSLSIYYHGVPVGGGFGSFISTTHAVNTPVMWTLSEPYGAKDWWPCKNGNDDKADSIEIIVTNPIGYIASSNGV